MKPTEVVTFGETMGLVLALDGPLSVARDARIDCAGAEATVAMGLVRLDHTVSYFGRVGEDTLGQRIRRTLRADGVDTTWLVDDPHPTGVLLRDATRDRPIDVAYYRAHSAGSHLAVADVPVATIQTSRVLHVTGITAALSDSAREATMQACRIARQAGVTVCLDPNVRLRLAGPGQWRALIAELAELADVVLVGDDDASVVCPDGDPVSWFRSRGVTRVVVKHGAVSATEQDGTGSWTVPGRTVALVDPIGAGDAFAAGWISGWLRDLSPTDRLREAHTVAACSVGYFGDTHGLPTASLRGGLLGYDRRDALR